MSAPFKVGQGFDVHAFTPNRQLILGGVNIPHTVGLLGHSDADVVIHSLCDAILGAFALGDIGHHFPDTDGQYKNIDSKILLKQVISLPALNGWILGNIDITIVAQAPKLAPFIPQMRQNFAEILSTEIDNISIKATTTEKLGFTGRKEGIASFATVLYYRQHLQL